jgi:hypothetical protein
MVIENKLINLKNKYKTIYFNLVIFIQFLDKYFIKLFFLKILTI